MENIVRLWCAKQAAQKAKKTAETKARKEALWKQCEKKKTKSVRATEWKSKALQISRKS